MFFISPLDSIYYYSSTMVEPRDQRGNNSTTKIAALASLQPILVCCRVIVLTKGK